jgi:hypothetical protein
MRTVNGLVLLCVVLFPPPPPLLGHPVNSFAVLLYSFNVADTSEGLIVVVVLAELGMVVVVVPLQLCLLVFFVLCHLSKLHCYFL